jgi:hypothetical protein
MKEFRLNFNAPVGDEHIKVEICQSNGTDSLCYHINIDNYCYGPIIKRNGEWIRLHVNSRELTIDDVQALGELVDEQLKSE